LTLPSRRLIVSYVRVALTSRHSSERPLAGEVVALLGKAHLFTKRDARALVERLGGAFAPEVTPKTTVVITGAGVVEVPPHVRRVMSENDLCREAGLPDIETLRSHYYTAKDLRGMYGVIRDEHLRYLEKWGLIHPVAGRYYSFNDLHVVKQAAGELERGQTIHAVLRTLSPDHGGQLSFDFQPPHAEKQPARVVSLPNLPSRTASLFPSGREEQVAAANYALAAKYFFDGAELDDGDHRDLPAAATAYRRSLMFDPQLVPALVNLANIHYECDELVEAEALYEKAVRTDAECFEGYFNLGNIHHDMSRYNEAVAAYRDALALNPNYPEAHFYLAVTLEKIGRSAEARPHWKQYCDLAPEGEFVALAREFLE
jgi:tetratricopeptide (TPR) repeat protein